MSDERNAVQGASKAELAEAKRYVRDTYIGQAGIHGVGIRSAKNAVRLYAKRQNEEEQDRLIGKIRQEIAPFALDVTFDDAPVALDKALSNPKHR